MSFLAYALVFFLALLTMLTAFMAAFRFVFRHDDADRLRALSELLTALAAIVTAMLGRRR